MLRIIVVNSSPFVTIVSAALLLQVIACTATISVAAAHISMMHTPSSFVSVKEGTATAAYI